MQISSEVWNLYAKYAKMRIGFRFFTFHTRFPTQTVIYDVSFFLGKKWFFSWFERVSVIPDTLTHFCPPLRFRNQVPTFAVRETDVSRHKGGTRGSPIMPRDAVSRTANVERNGGQKWVNVYFRSPLFHLANTRLWKCLRCFIRKCCDDCQKMQYVKICSGWAVFVFIYFSFIVLFECCTYIFHGILKMIIFPKIPN